MSIAAYLHHTLHPQDTIMKQRDAELCLQLTKLPRGSGYNDLTQRSILERRCQPTKTLRKKEVNRPGHVHVLLHAGQVRRVFLPNHLYKQVNSQASIITPNPQQHTHTHKRLHHLTARQKSREKEHRGVPSIRENGTPAKTNKRVFTCCSAEGTQQHHPPSSAKHETAATIAETIRLLPLYGGIRYLYQLIRRTNTESRYTTARRSHYPKQSCTTRSRPRLCRSIIVPTPSYLGNATHSSFLESYVGLKLQQPQLSTQR